MSYAELEVNLRKRSDENYSVEMWLRSPDSDADRLLTGDDAATLQIDREALRRAGSHPKAYGAVLSAAFFRDPAVGKAFAEARSAANDGLRVRFFIHSNADELHALPWERMADPDTLVALEKLTDPKILDNPDKCRPLLTSENLFFSRYLSSADRRRVPLRPKSDLRALVVAANPEGLERFGLAPINVAGKEGAPGEMDRARAALRGIELIELASGGSATLENIVSHLRRSGARPSPDILYLIGHGKLVGGKPVLYLEGEAGEVKPVEGEEFVRRLADLAEPPRLVVLASCQSAGTGDDAASADEGVLAALGPQMAGAGIAAVVAMQGNVTMKTVEQFMPVFFAELREHGQIDLAMATARGAVFGSRPLDWWAPALFMRLKSGRIWHLYAPGFSQGGLKQWPALMRAIERDRCAPVIGPGIYDSLLGSRRDIARRWAEAEGFPLAPESFEDMPQVAQFLAVDQDHFYVQTELEKHLRKELWTAFGAKLAPELQSASLDKLIKEAALAAEPGDDSPYRVLARLPLSIFITANPGDLLGDAMRAEGKDPQVEICRWNEDLDDVPSVFDREPGYVPTIKRPLVYHLFGRIPVEDSLVLTEDDYLLWLIGVNSNKERIPVVVRDAIAEKGLLFLGFGIDDWDFRMLLRYIMSFQGRAASKKHSNIAAQISLQGGRAIAPERAQSYLEEYFNDQQIDIFWGSSDDFASELARQRSAVA